MSRANPNNWEFRNGFIFLMPEGLLGWVYEIRIPLAEKGLQD
jgi:hypothetical protein